MFTDKIVSTQSTDADDASKKSEKWTCAIINGDER